MADIEAGSRSILWHETRTIMKTENPQAQTQAQPFTEEQMAAFFRSPEGQTILRQSRSPLVHKPKSPMSEDEIDKYCLMAEKVDAQYTRIDPKTKEPLTEIKGEETFWKILSVIPEAVGNNDAEIRVNFFIQRYWKNKTYKRQKSSSDSTEISEHEPWMLKKENRFTKVYSIVQTGDRIIDAEDFMAQFKRDAD
jgi:hypothetical protein